jgi:hypothetical protein
MSDATNPMDFEVLKDDSGMEHLYIPGDDTEMTLCFMPVGHLKLEPNATHQNVCPNCIAEMDRINEDVGASKPRIN